MIKNKQPLNMCEVVKTLESVNETDKVKDTKIFIKKFSKIDIKRAEKLTRELEGLGLLKLKSADIAKIIDILPEDATELNKIFTEVTLDADETNKILETIKVNK